MKCEKILLLIALCIGLQCCDHSISKNVNRKTTIFRSSSYEDPRDHKIYKIISFGDVTWFAENLRYDTMASVASDCMNNDSCEFYGRFYAQKIASAVCPPGWHLPTDKEWKNLEAALGMPSAEINREGIMRGIEVDEKMYETHFQKINMKYNGSCAYIDQGITHKQNNKMAGYWSSSQEKNSDSLWVRIFYPALNIARVRLDLKSDSSLFYIRCVKD